MELCDLGDLMGHTDDRHWEILKGSRMTPVPHAEMIIITLQMLLGVAYVHGKKMIHRDLAARNIMLKTGPGGAIVALLADLGMAREVGAGGYYSLKYTLDGDIIKIPVAWSPPESFEMQESKDGGDKKYKATQMLDLWALAVTLYEMLTNCSGGRNGGPYLADGTVHQIKTMKVKGPDGKKVKMEVVADHLADVALVRNFIVDKKDQTTGERTPGTGGRLHIPASCPLLLKVIIEALWSGDPAARPDAVQIILFIMENCALLTEAPKWENDAESAAKINAWLVEDLAIPVPRAAEIFGDMNYEVLVDDDGLLGDFKTELGDAFVLGETFKAMRRETRALKSLNEAVEQEPLKSALAKACEEAEKEEGGEAMQASLYEALVAAREEVVARRRAEEEKEEGEEKKAAAAADAAAADAAAAAAEAARIAREVEEKEAAGECLKSLRF
jgi:hypothetical protein